MTYINILFIIQCLLFKVYYSESVMEKFIVGGVHTNILSYPHSVFLRMTCDYEWICGGAIINQRIVLTAAHCFEGCTKKGLHKARAYAGNENIMQVKTFRFVTTLLLHRDYETEEVLNDIALGRIDGNFALGNTMKRVIIQWRFPSTRAGTVAGWGLQDENSDDISTVLKSLQQVIKSKAVCAKIGKLHSGMFCAGVVAQSNGHPSHGDSGSAFITKQYQQLGLVSFRIKRCPTLTVYTNVSYYYSWIKANTKQLFCYKNSAKYIQL